MKRVSQRSWDPEHLHSELVRALPFQASRSFAHQSRELGICCAVARKSRYQGRYHCTPGCHFFSIRPAAAPRCDSHSILSKTSERIAGSNRKLRFRLLCVARQLGVQFLKPCWVSSRQRGCRACFLAILLFRCSAPTADGALPDGAQAGLCSQIRCIWMNASVCQGPTLQRIRNVRIPRLP